MNIYLWFSLYHADSEKASIFLEFFIAGSAFFQVMTFIDELSFHDSIGIKKSWFSLGESATMGNMNSCT